MFDYFNFNNDCKEEIPTPELIELKDVCKLTKDSLGYEYLRDRGITNEQIDYYNLMNGMGNHLGRIIIPNLLIGKWTDFYQGRSYIGAKNKYSNPKNVDKTNIVFNLHNQTKGQKDFYLVEGAFDAIRGGYDVGSIYGSSISEVQVKLLNSYNFKNLHCCLDGDSAGQLGNNKMAEELLKNTNSNIYICKLPEDRDVGDMGEDEFKEYVNKYERLYINRKPFGDYDLYKINNEEELKILIGDACTFDDVNDVKNITKFPCIVCKKLVDEVSYICVNIDTVIEEYRNKANELERLKNIL